MAESESWQLYLDKVFQQPSYIWDHGQCNIDAVHDSLSHLEARLVDIIPQATLHGSSLPENTPTLDTADRQDVTASRSAIMPLRSDVWNGIEPINYHAQIAIGQEPQPFFVDLDTGSSLLWLQSRLDIEDLPVEDQTSYVPSQSRTSRDLQKSHEISYGDGSHVVASLFADEVTAGMLTAEAQTLGAAAIHNIKDAFRSKSSNGLLGLGFPLLTADTNADAVLDNIVLTLHKNRRLKYASMSIIGPRNDPKLAAQIDKNAIMQPRGWFVIGSVDPKFYTGSISWCPQLVPDRWIVALDQVLINGEVVLKNQRALIDTGTPYMVASPSNYEKIISKIMGASKWSQKQGLYFTYPKPNLQKVSFVFSGRTFNLFPQDFSLGGIKLFQKRKDGTAEPAEKDQPRLVSSIVRLASWQFDEDLWIIGGIFLDNVVTIFDFSERKVGFADISEEDFAHAPAAS